MQRGRTVALGLLLLLLLSLCPAPTVAQEAPGLPGPWGLWEERWVMSSPQAIINVIHDGTRYLATGQTGLYTSPDGRDWTLQPLPSGLSLGRIAFGLGRYYLVANDSLMTSDDARKWDPQDLGVGAVVREIAVGEDRVVLVGSVPGNTTPRQVAWLSTDGRAWTRYEIAPSLLRIVYHQGRFVGMTEKELYRSTDGVVWGRGRLDEAPLQVLKDVAAGNGVFVAVGESGTFLRSIDDGLSWTRESVSPTAHLHSVIFGGGRFIATGRRTAQVTEDDGTRSAVRIGALFSSTDGRNWQLHSKGDQDLALPLPGGETTEYGGTEELRILTYRPDEYLAAWEVPEERTARLYRSSDGVHWERIVRETPRTLVAIAYGHGTYVAFDTRGDLLTSVDGLSWNRHTNPIPMGARPPVIATGPDGFMLAGELGLYHSVDGITWTKQKVAASFVSVVAGGPRYLALSADGRVFVSDGETWKESQLPNRVRPRSIAFGAGRYVVVGEEGLIAGSTDGLTWFYAKSGTDVPLHSILYVNNAFLVVGGTSRDDADLARQAGTYQTVRSVMLTSKDGKAWSVLRQDAESLRAVTYANGLYVAVGSHLLVSLDRSTWSVTGSIHAIPRTGDTPGALLPPEAVVYGDGEFIVLWGQRLLVRRLVDPARSTITADRTTPLANGRDTVTLTVQLVDSRGRPLPSRTVQLTRGKQLVGTTVVTDGAGRAVLQVREDRPGAVTYGVRVGEDGKALTPTVTITWQKFEW